MTKSTGKRLTSSLAADLREEMADRLARIEERMDALERRRDVGDLLAEEIGSAVVRTVQRARTPVPRNERKNL